MHNNFPERDFFEDIDPLAETQPTSGLTQIVQPRNTLERSQRMKGFPVFQMGCSALLVGIIGILIVSALYLFFPGRTNILILGIDDRQEGQAVGRSDTMILVSFDPLSGKIGMLSIPRDLWVNVPGYGEGRINTAHFYAEANQPGSGLLAAQQVVEENFNIDVDYAVRIRFDNFVQLIDAVGGLEIVLDEPMSGYPAGSHILMAEEALAFVRDREGSDDFFRMQRGQILIQAAMGKLLSFEIITDIPELLVGFNQIIESDVPVFLWPRLGVNILRAGREGVNSQTIAREMVMPFTTSGGAQVLAPNWELINPVVDDMFRE